MTSPYPRDEEKIVNADAAKYTKESAAADESGDMFHDPPEYRLQRQLKNRHVAMIRFAKTLSFCLVIFY
jgi:amino acid permease